MEALAGVGAPRGWGDGARQSPNLTQENLEKVVYIAPTPVVHCAQHVQCAHGEVGERTAYGVAVWELQVGMDPEGQGSTEAVSEPGLQGEAEV